VTFNLSTLIFVSDMKISVIKDNTDHFLYIFYNLYQLINQYIFTGYIKRLGHLNK